MVFLLSVLFGRGEEKTSYANGHIPGSIHINTDEFEEGPIWNRLSDSQLKKVLEANGITKDTLVILYSTAQNMAAARIAWIMMYCGVQDVRLLDGGFKAWQNAGLPVFESIDGTMRNGDEITALWNEWGIRRGNEIATYCGTGWRAAEISFDFYVLGWPNIWLYDGGWYEWSNDPANPFLTGDQQPRFK